MFCPNCGVELQEGTQFCPSCGSRIGEAATPVTEKEVKVVLDPSEVVPAKETADSSKTFSGQGKTIGMVLILISIVIDLIAMCAVGSDGFTPILIGSSFLFVIGFFLRIFAP